MKTATVVTPTTQGVFHFGQGGGGVVAYLLILFGWHFRVNGSSMIRRVDKITRVRGKQRH